MKASAELTFDDLAGALRALAHDLADRAEVGYLLCRGRGAVLDRADGPRVGLVLDRGESHDGAGH